MTSRIRLRTSGDLAACVRMLRKVHERYGYPVNWPAAPRSWLINESDAAWVAEVEGRLVGHVSVKVDADLALVERLFVDPEWSGKGVGRTLLRRSAAEARMRATEVFLDVVAADDAANGLYRAEGWLEVSRSPIAWGPRPASTLIRYRHPW